MHEFDVVIIGAGVIGSALGRALSADKKFGSIAVLEKEDSPAVHTSGRNSGVVHSGFNPKPGGLKARLCVEGNRRLSQFCIDHRIPFERTGTLVVAQNMEEMPTLELLLSQGKANNVPDIRIIDAVELKKREPEAVGYAALFSPSGGITSGKMVTAALAEQAQANGCRFFFNTRVSGIEDSGAKIRLKTNHGELACERLVNCAGLYADEMAQMMGVGLEYVIVPFRGEYFRLKKELSGVLRSMVYPVPNPEYPFLGVHWTKTIDGDVIIGPNATIAMGRESYSTWSIDYLELLKMASRPHVRRMFASADFRKVAFSQFLVSVSKKKFVAEARKLIPKVSERDFVRGKSGNRAQLVDDKGHLVEDMVVRKKGNSLHVLNAISPGFTCAIPFADHLMAELSA